MKTISLLEEIMDAKASVLFGPADILPPSIVIYSAFIDWVYTER